MQYIALFLNWTSSTKTNGYKNSLFLCRPYLWYPFSLDKKHLEDRQRDFFFLSFDVKWGRFLLPSECCHRLPFPYWLKFISGKANPLFFPSNSSSKAVCGYHIIKTTYFSYDIYKLALNIFIFLTFIFFKSNSKAALGWLKKPNTF